MSKKAEKQSAKRKGALHEALGEFLQAYNDDELCIGEVIDVCTALIAERIAYLNKDSCPNCLAEAIDEECDALRRHARSCYAVYLEAEIEKNGDTAPKHLH